MPALYLKKEGQGSSSMFDMQSMLWKLTKRLFKWEYNILAPGHGSHVYELSTGKLIIHCNTERINDIIQTSCIPCTVEEWRAINGHVIMLLPTSRLSQDLLICDHTSRQKQRQIRTHNYLNRNENLNIWE